MIVAYDSRGQNFEFQRERRCASRVCRDPSPCPTKRSYGKRRGGKNRICTFFDNLFELASFFRPSPRIYLIIINSCRCILTCSMYFFFLLSAFRMRSICGKRVQSFVIRTPTLSLTHDLELEIHFHQQQHKKCLHVWSSWIAKCGQR